MPLTPQPDPADAALDVTIGILAWQACDMLRDLLDSIASASIACSFEIIVVDNASSDGTREMLAKAFPAVRCIANARNLGVAPARNQIFKAARGRYVLSLDVDTLVRPGAVDCLVEVMDAHPQAAVGGPRLEYEDGTLQLSCRPFPNLLNIAIEGTFLRNWFPNSRFVTRYSLCDWDHATLREVDWMYGACLIIRADVARRLNGFDEGFFYLYEDVDFCIRAKRAGLQVLYIPQATVVHFLRRELKGLFHPRIRAHLRSILRYLRKRYLT